MSAMNDNRYGRLTVIEMSGSVWTVRCDCGTVQTVKRKEILRTSIGRNGKPKATRSCGCLQKEAAAKIGRTRNRVHGGKGTPEYRSWGAMRNRCNNPKNRAYHNYGGRGITVCPEWDDFSQFLSDMGKRPGGTSIDRRNNDLGYFKENCYWATPKQQANNRRPRKKE